MSRPRKPTRVLEASGAFKKNPQRKRQGEPVVSEPVGNAPDHLTPEQRQAWAGIVSRAPAGVLTRADGLAVEIAACLWAEMMADFGNFTAAKLGRLHSLLGCFGMTPADRSKLGIATPNKEPNPFAEFL